MCGWAARHLQDGDRVLDVGGGGGYKASVLSDLMSVQVVGLDVSREALAERTVDPRLHANVVAAMEAAPFREGSFDAAIFFGALHHSPEPLLVLRGIRRILKPGGVVLLSEPNSLTMRLRGSGIEPANDIEFRFCTSFVLGQLRMAGFEVEEVTTESIASRLLDLFPGGSSYAGRRLGFVLDRLFLARVPLLNKMGAAMCICGRKAGAAEEARRAGR